MSKLRIFSFSIKLVARITGVVVLALVLGVIVFSTIITRMFTPEQLTAVLASQLQDRFNKPVVVDSARLVVFRGIRVQGLRVIDPKSPGEDMISSGPFTVDYQFWPLLMGRLVLTDLKIESPRIRFTRYEDGRWNIEGFNMKMSKDAMFDLAVDAAEVQNATIEIKDLKLKTRYSLYDVDFRFWRFKTDQEFPFRLAFRSKLKVGNRVLDADVYSEGSANLAGMHMENAKLIGTDIEIDMLRKPLYATVDVESFTAPRLHVSADLPAMEYADLAMFFKDPKGFRTPPVHCDVKAEYRQQGRFDVTSAVADFGGVRLNANGWYDFIASKYHFYAGASPFHLQDLSQWWEGLIPRMPGGTASLRAEFSDAPKGVRMDNLALRLSGARAVAGNFNFSGVDLTAQALNNMTGISGAVTRGTVKIGKDTITKMRGDFSYGGGNLDIPLLRATLNNKPMRARLSVQKISSPFRKINFDIALAELRIPTFFNMVGDISLSFGPHRPDRWKTHTLGWLRNFREKIPSFMPNFSGTIHADKLVTPFVSGSNLNIEYSLTGLLPGMSRLYGKVDAELNNGIFYQLEKMAAQEKALDVAFKPFIAMHKMEKSGAFSVGSVLRDVTFKKMALSFNMSKGASYINNFYISGSSISATLSGVADWYGEGLNLNMDTLFNSVSKYGGLSENLTDASGKPALSFSVKGKMYAPLTEMKVPTGAGKSIDRSIKKGVRTDFKRIQRFLREGN